MTSEVVHFIISSVIMLFNFYITVQEYHKFPNRFSKYLVIEWFFFMLFMILGVFQYLFLSDLIFKIQGILIIPILFSNVFIYDRLTRYAIDYRKTFLLGIVTTFLMIELFSRNNVIQVSLPGGGLSLEAIGGLFIIASVISISNFLLFFIISLKMFQLAPPSLKKNALIMLLSQCILSIIPLLMYLFGIVKNYPGLHSNLLSLAVLIFTLLIQRSSELSNILDQTSFSASMKYIETILPICADCHRIRNAEGEWVRLETYFRETSDIKFTHGICPDCDAKQDPEEIHF